MMLDQQLAALIDFVTTDLIFASLTDEQHIHLVSTLPSCLAGPEPTWDEEQVEMLGRMIDHELRYMGTDSFQNLSFQAQHGVREELEAKIGKRGMILDRVTKARVSGHPLRQEPTVT
jgi:hypothetical protein